MNLTEVEARRVADVLGEPFIGGGEIPPPPRRDPNVVRTQVERDGSLWANVVELAEILEKRSDEYPTVRDVIAALREMQTLGDERTKAALEREETTD